MTKNNDSVKNPLQIFRSVFCMTLLALLIAMLCNATSVFAETREGMCGDELLYKYDDDAKTLLIAGTGDMYDFTYGNSPFRGMRFETLTVQEKTHGTGITSIGDYAFVGINSLTSVSLPSTLIKIGKGAFSNCIRLKEITIPDRVTSIGDNAFTKCSSLEKVHMASKGIKTMGNNVFYDCSKLSEVQLPQTLTSLGTDTFEGCYALKTITIPSTLSVIPIGTFRYCSQLQTVTIPKTITKIGNYAFDRCYGLKTIYYGGTNRQWLDLDIGDSMVGNYVIYGADVKVILTEETGNGPVTFDGTVHLSKSTYVYNGKSLKPTVTAIHRGKHLKSGTDYKVTYKNNRKVGTATATVTFIGNYKGSVKKTFTINPIQPKLLTLKSSAAKKMTLTWRKDTGLTGFQIQYANNSSFSKAKKVTVKGNLAKNTIKSLKSGKKYYVRLRAYKKVGGKYYYSSWSNKKSVKVK